MATPADPPLWFIRDLMVCMVLSPVIWFVISRKVICCILILLFAVPWFLNIPCLYPFPGVSIPSIFFFMIGSIAAFWNIDIAKWFNNIKRTYLWLSVYILLSIIELVMIDYSISIDGERVVIKIIQNAYLHALLVFIGCFAFISIVYRLTGSVSGNLGGHFLCSQVIGCSFISQK